MISMNYDLYFSLCGGIIKDLGHMVLLEWVTAHSVNDGLFNPYFQWELGLVGDTNFFMPKKISNHLFPMTKR